MKKFISVCILVGMCACAPTQIMSTDTAYGVDTSVNTVLTAEAFVLTRPCGKVYTTVCVTPDMATTMKSSREIIMAMRKTYRGARADYIKTISTGGTPDEAANAAAYNALQSSIDNAKKILALGTFKSILALGGIKL